MSLDKVAVRNFDTGLGADIRTTKVNPTSPDADVHIFHHVSEVAPVENRLSGVGNATGGSSTHVAGMDPATGERAYISAVQVANAGLSAVLVVLQDGSGGTVLGYIECPAGSTIPVTYLSPLKTSVDNALYFQVMDSVPSPATTNVYVSAQGYSE